MVHLVNMYAPYKDRKPFWETVESSGVLRLKILIVGGDMNFTLFSNEVWGYLAPLDPLAPFFNYLLEHNHLVDVHPVKVSPTWCNLISGLFGINKRLDRFVMAKSLCSSLEIFHSWVVTSDISDHFPISFQVEADLE